MSRCIDPAGARAGAGTLGAQSAKSIHPARRLAHGKALQSAAAAAAAAADDFRRERTPAMNRPLARALPSRLGAKGAAAARVYPQVKKDKPVVADSEDDSAAEEEDELDAEETVTNFHRLFLRKYKKETLLSAELDVETFVGERSEAVRNSLDKRGRHGWTLLHTMFDGPKKLRRPGERLWELLEWLMMTYPDLYLCGQDSDKCKTILHMAAQLNIASSDLATAFITAFPEQAAIILRTANPKDNLLRDAMPHIRRCKVELFPILFDVRDEEITAADAAGNTGTLEWLAAIGKDNNTALHLAASYEPPGAQYTEETPNSQLQLVQQVFKAYPGALRKTNSAGHSPYQYRVHMFEKWCKEHPGVPAADIREDEIAYFLKDKIMHFSDHETTIRLLHGEFQESQIHLDLVELEHRSQAASVNDLKELVQSLKFENILQYVQIPRHLFSSRTKAGSSSPSTDKQGGVGRTEFKLIFDLLRKKGVKKIIKLIVDDAEETPHSDEVIETLNCFNIEEWDWRKVDLCSEVIRTAAPHAQVVFLYSSGNSAVLRSWSGTEGLNQLPELRKVHLFIRQRLESAARTKLYAETFQARMKQNCGDQVEIPEPRIQKATGQVNQSWFPGSDKLSTNAWLETMDKFGQFIGEREVASGEEVRVAIIDDGVDHMQPDIKGYVHEGVSFYTERESFHKHSNSVPNPWYPFYFSSQGHGTLMAQLVLRVCPMAQLYIARLNQGYSTSGKLQPTAESAAKAIRWAIKSKVHVISMSWTIVETARNAAELQDLKRAISEARDARILMFGASSDQGWNSSSTPYPAKHEGVICIGAAKGSGHAEDFAEKDADYFFPGGSLGISLQQQPREQMQPQQMASGSSIATALAAGLTSLILYCVKISRFADEFADYVQDHANMRLVFATMAEKEQPKYIGVERVFGTRFRDDDAAWMREGPKRLDDAVEHILTACKNKKIGY